MALITAIVIHLGWWVVKTSVEFWLNFNIFLFVRFHWDYTLRWL